ncbi:hypothetical protein PoB_001728400 [Plakobranchus ocellatus]|uniref:Uncharacterized protein n=1 Tax=Plakobranchus ocellatus TaxID=259542 RepID=A0AAV3Z631_9GAST|nr:hypothetical protein PoB_001728400 [Plakobranchus ocellatus]
MTDYSSSWGVGGTVASESALRSAGILLSRVRAPPTAPWPVGGPESLRSPCCGLAIYKNPTQFVFIPIIGTLLRNCCPLIVTRIKKLLSSCGRLNGVLSYIQSYS